MRRKFSIPTPSGMLGPGAVIISKGLRPERATPHSAGYDLTYAGSTPIFLDADETQTFPTGVWLAIPDGHVGMVCSRSGLAMRRSIAVLNSPGIIDPDYRGEVGVVLHNHAPTSYIVSPGERIAQLLIMPTSVVVWHDSAKLFDSLEETERAEGGFGSTGV